MLFPPPKLSQIYLAAAIQCAMHQELHDHLRALANQLRRLNETLTSEVGWLLAVLRVCPPDVHSSIEFAFKSDPSNLYSLSLDGCGGYTSDPIGAGQTSCRYCNPSHDSLLHTQRTRGLSYVSAYQSGSVYAQVGSDVFQPTASRTARQPDSQQPAKQPASAASQPAKDSRGDCVVLCLELIVHPHPVSLS